MGVGGSICFTLQFSCITPCFTFKALQLSAARKPLSQPAIKAAILVREPAERDVRRELEKENGNCSIQSGD